MAIVVTLVSVDRPTLETIQIVVEFADGADILTRTYTYLASDDISLAKLRTIVEADRNDLEALKNAVNLLMPYMGQVIPL